MSEEEIKRAKQVLADNGVKVVPTAWQAKVDKYGLEGARAMQRNARSKVNPKNIKGRPKGKIGADAEG